MFCEIINYYFRTNIREEAGICSRLRSRKRQLTQNQPRQKIKKKRKSKLESKSDQAEDLKSKSDDIDSLHGMSMFYKSIGFYKLQEVLS